MAMPQLRFKEFDGDWSKNTIGDFVSNYKGGASLTPADFMDYSEYEVIPKKAISSGGLLQLDKEVPTFCTSEFFNSNKHYVVDSEYLITTLRDLVPSGPSIGYIVKYEGDKKYILAQGVYGFRVTKDLCGDFLIQFSNTSKFRSYMQSIMVGSTQVHIRNQDYFSTEFYNPSLKEQTKIASFLSNVDEKISQLTQKHELLSQYKQGMMQKLFSQQIRFKADDGSEFGEWEDITLGQTGKFIGGGTPSKENSEFWEGSIPWISSSDLIDQSIFKINITRFISGNALNQSATKLVPANSILIVSRVGVGKVAITSHEICTSQDFTSLALTDGNPIFFAYLIKSLTPYLLEMNQGTSIKGFVKEDLSNLEIQVPCLVEQTQIANFLSAIDQKIEVVAQQIEQAKTWKKGLLQQMFV